MDVLSLGVPAQELPADEHGSEDRNKTEGGSTKGPETTRYASVTLMQCLNLLLGPAGQEALEYQCEGGCGKVSAVRQLHFATFPDVLVLHAKKFQLKNWVPTKLGRLRSCFTSKWRSFNNAPMTDIPIVLPEADTLDLGTFLGQGLQPNEEELPDGSSPALPQLDIEVLGQLEGMGFPSVRCQKALLATGNSGMETAMEWLFSHMDDPGMLSNISLLCHSSHPVVQDIDQPIQLSQSGAKKTAEPSSDQIAMLADMGFTHAQARKALMETVGTQPSYKTGL